MHFSHLCGSRMTNSFALKQLLQLKADNLCIYIYSNQLCVGEQRRRGSIAMHIHIKFEPENKNKREEGTAAG